MSADNPIPDRTVSNNTNAHVFTIAEGYVIQDDESWCWELDPILRKHFPNLTEKERYVCRKILNDVSALATLYTNWRDYAHFRRHDKIVDEILQANVGRLLFRDRNEVEDTIEKLWWDHTIELTGFFYPFGEGEVTHFERDVQLHLPGALEAEAEEMRMNARERYEQSLDEHRRA